ncbi:MAG: queuosine precursor transporter [Thermonemataceae bacterium]|nr:queuosine precursor transporter [Thermonemataceae bacterium]
MKEEILYQNKKRNLYLILGAIVISNALIAEIIGTKIFSLEKTLGFAPSQIKLFANFLLDFNLTAGVIIWPVVFVTSDIINEYFGVKGVRRISLLAATIILYAFLSMGVAMYVEPADSWLKYNSVDENNQYFNINFAFKKIFSQSNRIILGSLTAFIIAQIADAYVFFHLRRVTGSKNIWLRATTSTLISQLFDSFVVLIIAFYPQWSIAEVISIGIINYIYKFVIAILMIPLLYIIYGVIKRYMGSNFEERLVKEAGHL